MRKLKKYAIADIHGNYKALMQCLRKCNFDYENDVLISLGDIVDGFPQSYECVTELLKIKNLISIQGNHDQLFLEFINTGSHQFEWRQGFDSTASSYLLNLPTQKEINKRLDLGWITTFKPDDVPHTHKEFFDRQIPYYIDNDCLFVHGGFNRHFPIKDQLPFSFMWDRDFWMSAVSFDAIGYKDFKIKDKFNNIFIGHTSTTLWRQETPMMKYNIINLDTGAGNVKGRLTIMNVDTKEYWQSEVSSLLYPHHTPRKK